MPKAERSIIEKATSTADKAFSGKYIDPKNPCFDCLYYMPDEIPGKQCEAHLNVLRAAYLRQCIGHEPAENGSNAEHNQGMYPQWPKALGTDPAIPARETLRRRKKR